ncbi:hypothetical protein RISK_002969 [Rhodopirellula islandica]|uniref:Uncharacterized protein n=2 Tax=Rhodopirellula islandica TaxID=595434 RepID=A0A0J1BEN9_RHOIS|nr:hypothetical protein [Rhodopirellula islandica]KLU04976.1 hypothetical protein RISK_002969 [Rhodopirellula islandica]
MRSDSQPNPDRSPAPDNGPGAEKRAQRRWQRLLHLLPGLAQQLTPPTFDACCRILHGGPHPVLAPICSRLGHSPVRHREMARQLAASMMDAREHREHVVTIQKSAAEPWVTQAAKTFDLPLVRWDASQLASPEQLGSLPPNIAFHKIAQHRDEWIIAVADRVDVLHLRRGGKIEQAVLRRLEVDPFGVRVGMDDPKAAERVLEAGALGRFLPRTSSTASDEPLPRREPSSPTVSPMPSVLEQDEWLVHCTRRCDGPWPGQSWPQYYDEMLLGSDEAASRESLDSLRRIVRMRRLIAGATTSKSEHRVVCLSAVPLPELLRRRTFRSHVSRWDYEPFGIAIRRSAATAMGVRPVVYGPAAVRDGLPAEERYRYQAEGRDQGWTAENEWRSLGDVDLDSLDANDVCVFVPDQADAQVIAEVNHRGWRVCQVEPLLQPSAQ